MALACIACWFDPAVALAEGPTDHSPQPRNAERELGLDELSVAWSPRLVLRLDEIGSPRTLVGPALGAATIWYARTRGPNAQRAELDFSVSTLRSQPDFEYVDWPSEQTAKAGGAQHVYVRLRYAYLREIPLQAERWDLRVGPGVDFDVQKFDYVAGPSVIGGYHGIFALDLRAEAEVRPAGGHRVRFGVGLPTFAWVARSPYAINDAESIHANLHHKGAETFFRYVGNGEIQSWRRLQAARVEARYDVSLQEHVAVSLGFHGRVLSNSTPRPLVLQEYGASFALTARF